MASPGKLHCTIKLNTTLSKFENGGGKSKFIDNLSSSLGIKASTIDITSMREGSVILDYTITVSENQMESLKKAQDQQIKNNLIDFGAPVLDFVSKSEDPSDIYDAPEPPRRKRGTAVASPSGSPHRGKEAF